MTNSTSTQMNTNRKIAIIVGVFYIIATVAGIISGYFFLGPVLEEPLNLVNVAANEKQVIIGTLFYFIMAVAVAGIAIVIYPVLRKHNEVLALGYAGARIVEGVFFTVNIVTILTLLTLSQGFVKAGAPDASYFQTLGQLLLAAGEWAYMFGELVFCLSALMLYYLLYQSKLIPRWLSGWGFVAAILWPVGSLSLFGSTTSDLFYFPMFVQEMVFAVWLIVKGFNSSAIASESAK